MIPLRDNIPSRTTPFVSYTMIGICVLVFLQQLGNERLVEQYGMIPKRVGNPNAEITIRKPEIVRVPGGFQRGIREQPAAESAVPPWLTLLTCIFLHGGWLHIIGNLWFLHIFGDNVEDRFGHVGFLLLYLGGGVAASAVHLWSNPGSTVPTIGASGAIAGVMGAYYVLYPRAKVLTLIPIFFFLYMIVVPAPVFLGIWFLIQFFQGTATLSSAQQGGVAWWAHIGGFVAGAAVAWLLKGTRALRPPVESVRPYADGTRYYRIRGR